MALAGGGITGYFFESGSICAMLDCGLSLNIFSGISAGAAVAALAAHDLPPHTYDPFSYVKLHYFRDMNKLSVILYGLFGAALMLKSKKQRESLYEFCFRAPKNLLSLKPLEIFFTQTLTNNPKELYITATNIDTGEEKVFTNKDNIPKAVRASCSFPGIAKPTVLNGGHYVDAIVSCTANIKAVAHSDLIICVNPITLTPVPTGHISERGIFKIFDQSFRTLNRVRLEADMQKVEKNKDIILIEPCNCQIMSKNPMRKDLRLEALQSGYDCTMKILSESVDIFKKHGITINRPADKRSFD